jgi:hypothetical protein
MSEASVTSPIERLVMCESPTIPTAKKYKETQFSTVKKRIGQESVPFLDLPAGIHKVKFYNDKREAVLTVKTWLSPYGWAWKIVST